MSNTQKQNRILSRLNAREVSVEELEAIAGGILTSVCTVGTTPQLITTDGECPGCPT